MSRPIRAKPLTLLLFFFASVSLRVFVFSPPQLHAGEPTLEEKKKELLSRVGDPENAEGLQALAAREAIALGLDDATAAVLFDKITHRTSPALARGLIVEMGNSSYPAFGAKLVERWLRLPLASKQAAFPLFFRRSAWTGALLDGLYNGLIESSELSPADTQLLLFHPDAALAARARTYLESRKLLPEMNRERVLEQFVPALEQPPDLRAGARAFAQHCAQCHRFYETGKRFGPDLAGAHLRSKLDLLIDVLDPHRKIAGVWKPLAVFTRDERLYVGLLQSETEHNIELATSGEGRSDVLRSDVIARKLPLERSLMPIGFERLGARTIVDILGYLQDRPRLFPLSLKDAATASSATRLFSGEDDAEKLVLGRWGPHVVEGVGFELLDPEGGKQKNAIVLHSPRGKVSAAFPKSVRLPLKSDAAELHFLAGVAGFGFPVTPAGTVSLTVRLHYADGKTEDHVWKNGEQICDVDGPAEVPGSKRALALLTRQVRYLSIKPRQPKEILEALEFIKGDDETAPLILGLSVERAP